MPTTQPSLTLLALSSTSFSATVAGSDVGSTNTIYYRQIGTQNDLVGNNVVNNGVIAASALVTNAGYLAWLVSDVAGVKSLPAHGFVSLATTDTLSGAIVAKWSLDGALQTVVPQLWAEEVPENDVNGNIINLPFGVVEVGEEVPEYNFESSFTGTGYYEIGQVKVTLYSTQAVLTDQMANAFKSSYDWKDLPFSSAASIALRREKSSRGPEEIMDRNGNVVFHRVIEYEAWVGR